MSRGSHSRTHACALFLEDLENSRGHVVIGMHEYFADQVESILQVLVKSLHAHLKGKAITVLRSLVPGAVPVIAAHDAAEAAGVDIDLVAKGSIAVGFRIKNTEKGLENTQAADVFFRQFTDIEQESHVVDLVGELGMCDTGKTG